MRQHPQTDIDSRRLKSALRICRVTRSGTTDAPERPVERPICLKFFSTALFTIGDHLKDVKTGDTEKVGHSDNIR